ncbi:MAG: bifunctional phosphopantothenoylcysteine decarboxylase/phosphopantothenate--cysteine ligase CoaBC [Actinomycetota bacterium]|nr:MAG: bifunctional phosphopantothenoylcysteine decarboxylase/phosphopantothenate--cysteine ligase CoaBC [Actinomycetota bacterium]
MSTSSSLNGKRIVLGVGGGIAAYKSIELLRRLVDSGAFVSPVLTQSSLKFVGETTFSALGSEPARTSLWDSGDPIPHTRLGQQADVIVVSPATADLIARYAAGIADDLLTTTLVATSAPVVMVAAMHTEMWQHPSVEDNIATLRRRGVIVIEPETGRLAGGDIGVGRLATIERVVATIEGLFIKSNKSGSLSGKKVLVTAGGTREAIDPVRYIGNRSSGKQGIAFAEQAANFGAEVTLVSTVPAAAGRGVEVIEVESAQEMFDAVSALAGETDLVVMAAAVADFRSKIISPTKIKKNNGAPQIVLEPTPDILAYLGSVKPKNQVLVGFAAETGDPEAEARRKLKAKNADFVVANNVLEHDAGFAVDTNRVTLVFGDSQVTLALADKRDIASKVLSFVAEWAFKNGVWSE